MCDRVVVALHRTDPERVAGVEEEMRVAGPPTIRAIVGVTPTIEVVADEDTSNDALVTGLDLDDRDTWSVGDLRDYVTRPGDGRAAVYTVTV